jgi:hypothetical protein
VIPFLLLSSHLQHCHVIHTIQFTTLFSGSLFEWRTPEYLCDDFIIIDILSPLIVSRFPLKLRHIQLEGERERAVLKMSVFCFFFLKSIFIILKNSPLNVNGERAGVGALYGIPLTECVEPSLNHDKRDDIAAGLCYLLSVFIA